MTNPATPADPLRAALRLLEKIADWQLPPSGQFAIDGHEFSFGYCYGSNGERDHMRQAARDAAGFVRAALAAPQAEPAAQPVAAVPAPTEPTQLHREAVDHAHEILRRLGYHRDADHFINVSRVGAEAIHITTIGAIVNAALIAAAPKAPAVPAEPARCRNCDDTGDVNSITGEWRGRCHCKAGRTAQPVAAVPAPTDGAVEPGSWAHLKLMMQHSAWGDRLELDDALKNIDDFVAAGPKAPAVPAPQWMPIETAPKDGRRLLVAVDGVDRAVVAVWNGGAWQTIDGHNWEGRAVTHWMPLPAAPKEQA